MKTVAIVLSGCGFLDGSEIYETVTTFLALDKYGVDYACFAPDIPQTRVINYLTGEPMDETRHVLIESARLARGQVTNILDGDPNNFDALIFPGGFGAVTHLSNFALQGKGYTVEPGVKAFAQAFIAQKKPLGFICIAPALIPAICGQGVTLTIGNDPQTAATLEQMGAKHHLCDARHSVIDQARKIVSTPAYMVGKGIAEVAEGIEHLVAAVLSLT